MRGVRGVRACPASPPRGHGARAAAVTAAAMAAAVAALAAGAAPAQASTSFLTLIDNSEADSWLEIDRTANIETGGGTAGSDHDGSAVDLMDTLINPDRPGDEDED
ncbi:hypothetical protein ACPXCE_17530 [Streptomyces sp. DT24]|uniref:hypothetical protein n=1 Tax=unclassified Streptomyces TaxID=2593676 RepID=UPI0023BA26E9|nr:hypothetical protein [Streptomyces sp. AM 4-1-1]WEH32043.1 hypothetical protein PZB75_00805 [Streptomyces sp. AM 4-1-1]